MTQPLKGVRNIPGFGTTLPTDKVHRQAALMEQIKRKDKAEQDLHEKIKARVHVPGEEGATQTK